jgi:hypothetical protein
MARKKQTQKVEATETIGLFGRLAAMAGFYLSTARSDGISNAKHADADILTAINMAAQQEHVATITKSLDGIAEAIINVAYEISRIADARQGVASNVCNDCAAGAAYRVRGN